MGRYFGGVTVTSTSATEIFIPAVAKVTIAVAMTGNQKIPAGE